jgi:hypothetical protein
MRMSLFIPPHCDAWGTMSARLPLAPSSRTTAARASEDGGLVLLLHITASTLYAVTAYNGKMVSGLRRDNETTTTVRGERMVNLSKSRAHCDAFPK